ncbi:protein kinase [Nannocystis sp. ILAH1]|uniref:serine/threonine-protein kinase n=1 Tax=Nannocystis sp. ILAH1 TaxID=2996789 RepID=UPI00226D6D76|nr:serine/threonine protein kinase [Nannocystis sp. ILAH1]MCY0987578.1 protein kinase [Nannocystis sp. ILAH1]
MGRLGQVFENRYRLLELIGVGGMGAVYLAEHVYLGEVCAVKVLSPRFAFDPEWVERFLLEAQAAIRIRHDNVVQIKDFACPEPGLVYMVMEAISGESLADLLRREGVIHWERALRMTAQVAAALEAAHARGIIHRDIKPSNCVRTTSRGDPDFIKVLDFGIAKFTAAADKDARVPKTATGVWMGTAEYMAPEMYRGEPPDARVDIYALGVLLYKLITGETPFRGSHLEVAVEQSRRGPRPPSERAPDREIPAEVDALVLRALAPELNSRTPSMAALRGEIAATLVSLTEESSSTDREDHEPTLIRKRILPADSTPAGRTPPPSSSPAPVAPIAVRSLASVTTPPADNAPMDGEPAPTITDRPRVVPLKPKGAISAGRGPVATTEVTPAKRGPGRTSLVAGSLAAAMALVAVVWQVTARPTPEVEAALDAPSVEVEEPSANKPAPVSAPEPSLAPAPESPSPPVLGDPAPPSTPLAPPQPASGPSIEKTSEAKKSATPNRPAKPRPSPRKPEPEPPVLDPRPAVLTERDVSGIFRRIEKECLNWGVPRGRSATLVVSITSEGTASHEMIGISDPYFVDCLGSKLKKAKFPESQNGGKLHHLFTCG